jgi:hypothetical protein
LDNQVNQDLSKNSNDIYVIQFDANTGLRKSKLIGTMKDDVAYDIKIDSKGNMYICGFTNGGFMDQKNRGGFDNLLLKLDRNANILWARQWGSGADGNLKHFSYRLCLSIRY